MSYTYAQNVIHHMVFTRTNKKKSHLVAGPNWFSDENVSRPQAL